jgi:hypothetical protein
MMPKAITLPVVALTLGRADCSTLTLLAQHQEVLLFRGIAEVLEGSVNLILFLIS